MKKLRHREYPCPRVLRRIPCFHRKTESLQTNHSISTIIINKCHEISKSPHTSGVHRTHPDELNHIFHSTVLLNFLEIVSESFFPVNRITCFYNTAINNLYLLIIFIFVLTRMYVDIYNNCLFQRNESTVIDTNVGN